MADFTWVADGLTVTFDGGAGTFWDWDFDYPSGTDSTDQSPVWTYPAPGSYLVHLLWNGSEEVTHTVTVTGPTTAVGKDATLKWDVATPIRHLKCDFDFTPPTGDAPLSVTFTDKSIAGDNAIDGWSWQFEYPATDSGRTSTAQNPTHLYPNYGYFTVLLVVTAGPETAECAKTILIVAGAGPDPAGAVPFTMGGSDVATDDVPFFVQGMGTQTGSVELFLQNIDATAQALSLFTAGASGPAESVPFVVGGSSLAADSVPFVVEGFQPTAEGSLNFSMMGSPVPSVGGSVEMSVSGSTNPTVAGSLDFVITADVGQLAGSVNLSVAAQPSELASSSLNMSVFSANPSVADAVPFVLAAGEPVCPVSWDTWLDHWDSAAGVWGCDPAETASFPMFLAGSPVGNFAQSLNMFLQRPTTAMVPFVLFGPAATTEGGVPFVMDGKGSVQQGMDLVVPDVKGQEEEGVRLYTRGW